MESGNSNVFVCFFWFFSFLCVCVFCLYLYMCTICMPGALRDQIRVSRFLELELQVVVIKISDTRIQKTLKSTQ